MKLPGSCMEGELVGEGCRQTGDRADDMVQRRGEGDRQRTSGKQMEGKDLATDWICEQDRRRPREQS